MARATWKPDDEKDLSPTPDTPVYLLYGTDEFRVATEARRLADALCPPESQTLGMEEISGVADSADAAAQSLRQCLAAVLTVGFFGGRKLVWYRDVSFLKSAKILQNAAVKSWLGQLTDVLKAGLPSGHQLLLSAREVDGRSALAKACGAAGQVGIYQMPERDSEAILRAGGLAREAFTRVPLKISESAIAEFVNKVGYETRTLHSEVEKLAVYLGPGGTVTSKDIAEVVSSSRESAGWDFAAALFQRDLAGALTVLRRLLNQKEEPIGLLTLLDNRCREALLLLDCKQRRWLSLNGPNVVWASDPAAAATLDALGPRDPRRIHPFRAGMILKESERFTLAELERWRSAIMKTREQIVSEATPGDLLLEFLTLSLLGRTTGPRAAGPAKA